MKKKKLFAGALALMMAAPMAALADGGVIINGSVIDWYAYGKDIHGGGNTWIQMIPGSIELSNVGIASFGLDASATDGKPVWLADFPIRNNTLYSNAGGIYVGGNTFYSFFGHEVGWEDNMEGEYGSEQQEILVRMFTWDIDASGAWTNVKCQQVGKLNYQPTDLAYDPLYDKAYGIFYFSHGDESGYKLGELNLNDWSVRFISREAMPITGELRTLAINSKGELYGTDASGNIYKVDKEDGTLTYIGNMGFKSQHRMMSAAFDLRTDKMYWLGYLNNGKISAATDGTNNTLSIADGGRDTGFYEIDVNTGNATLIGNTNFKQNVEQKDDEGDMVTVTQKFGKFQLTGIWVDGSFEKKEVDQCVSFQTVPAQLKVGQESEIIVNIKNIGLKDIAEDDWKVNLYANGELIASKSGRDLEVGELRQQKFAYTAPQNPGTVNIYAEVVNEKDLEARNNKSEVAAIIVLDTKCLPGVQVEGTVNGNSLSLAWTNPNGRMVEGAENFAPFCYEDLGAWMTYDGDKGYTQRPSSFNASINYANWSTPKAYIVWNAKKAGADITVGGEKLMAHTGSQSFAAWWTAVPDDSEAGGHQVANDDWLISPALTGNAQTIEFWGKGYKGAEATGYATEMNPLELMRVLYTTKEYTASTEWKAEDWQVARDTFEIENSVWTRYKAQLPEGAKHFALQCCSPDGFVTMIDDIAFDVNVGPVTGYNVYKNGVKVTTLAADATGYNVARAEASAAYTVTAVYAEGESYPSNAVGIDIINAISEATAVPTAKGMQIFNMKGQQVNVMNRPGLYIIKQNGKSRKVMVK